MIISPINCFTSFFSLAWIWSKGGERQGEARKGGGEERPGHSQAGAGKGQGGRGGAGGACLTHVRAGRGPQDHHTITLSHYHTITLSQDHHTITRGVRGGWILTAVMSEVEPSPVDSDIPVYSDPAPEVHHDDEHRPQCEEDAQQHEGLAPPVVATQCHMRRGGSRR